MSDKIGLSPNSRLVAYLRDSGGREQNQSIPQQEAAVGEWCKNNGYILTRIFKDIARSGLRTASRDQFLEMVSYLETHPPEAGVIFWEYARLSRDYDDLMYYVADLRRMGYTVYSLTDQIPEGLEGRLMESIIAWKNAKYSEDMSKNIKRGHRYLISVHKAWPGGRPPKGYRYNTVQIGIRRDGTPHMANKLEIDPELAPLIRRAFEMRAKGATFNEIHDEIHLFKWLVDYRRMLTKSSYCGIVNFGGVDYLDVCEPIVDRATWEAAQRVNRERSERVGANHPRTVRSRFFLTGLLYCARCGGTMHGTVQPQRKPYTTTYDYYRCSSRVARPVGVCRAPQIPRQELEERVISIVCTSLLDPVVLADLYSEIVCQLESDRDVWDMQVAQVQSELKDTRSQVSRIVSAIRQAGHSTALLTELEALEERERELTRQLVEIETSPPELLQIDPQTLVEDTRRALDLATEIEKGIILRGFVHRVVAERVDRVISGEVEYYIPGSERVLSMSL